MVILLVVLSVVVFIVIQLPPGDMMTVMLARMEAGGADASLGGVEITAMQKQYGLHLPAHRQYLRWAGNLLRGNLGPSFVYGRPVTVLLLERLPLTVPLSGITLLFAYAVAVPIGIYSATHQYSLGDYGITVVGFVGLATPNFLLALILMYLLLTLFLSVVGWTGLARVVRGKLLELREADFVMAARIAGVVERNIIARHLLPSFMSYLIVSLTLSIPGMILAETALSFLGVGIQPPAISWGALLQGAQNVRTVALAPWLFIPGLFIVLTVLSFNFVGDGLRDAADPYR